MRSTAGYQAAAEDPEDIRIKRLLDEIYLIDPCLGSRRLVTVLERDHGVKVNRKRLDRLRREMGHEAIWCKPRTSIPDDGHRKYPYLLRKLAIKRPDHVWCADITYVPMPRGHAYLCAVMDWYSRKVLGSAVSITMCTGLCLEALEMALGSAGKVPERLFWNCQQVWPTAWSLLTTDPRTSAYRVVHTSPDASRSLHGAMPSQRWQPRIRPLDSRKPH